MAFSILYCISAPLQTFCLLAMRDLHQEALLFIRAAYFRDYKSLLIGVWGGRFGKGQMYTVLVQTFLARFFFCCSVSQIFSRFHSLLFQHFAYWKFPRNFMIAVFSLGKSCNGCNFYLCNFYASGSYSYAANIWLLFSKLFLHITDPFSKQVCSTGPDCGFAYFGNRNSD